jgi:hypothetical protein
MAQFTVTIEGDELSELQSIVAGIIREQPGSKMTENQYAENIIRGYLQTRIRQAYIGHVQSQPIETLRTKLGTIQQIRSVTSGK